jgi:hypothetical protein
MGKPYTKFEPVQVKPASGWYVRITLPHGERSDINYFKTEHEAITWIYENSEAWLKRYRGGRYA